MAHIQQVEALAPLRKLGREILGLGLLFAIFACAGAILIASRFSAAVSGPLGGLLRRVQGAEAGDLESPVAIEGPAEVQALGRGISELTSSLKRSNQFRDDLISIVSHDLKNPLSAMGLSVKACDQLLRRQPEAPAEQLRLMVMRLDRSVRHMRQLIESLLIRAVVDSGRFVIDSRRYEVGALVSDLIEMFQPIALDKGVELDCDVEETPLYAVFDCERIHEVLSNLIGNAIKFTPKGGRVTVTAERAGDRVRFGVLDTGQGIVPEDLTRVFDRHFRATKLGVAGRGLGLYIAKQIVEAHGGRIWAESEPGQGARFYFELQAQERPPAAVGPELEIKKTG